MDCVKLSDYSIDILGTREDILKRRVDGYNEKTEGRNQVQKLEKMREVLIKQVLIISDSTIDIEEKN